MSAEDTLAERVRALLADLPLIVSGVERDLSRSPRGRGGTLRHQPETQGWGDSGCPGDNLTSWFDRLRALLPADSAEAVESELARHRFLTEPVVRPQAEDTRPEVETLAEIIESAPLEFNHGIHAGRASRAVIAAGWVSPAEVEARERDAAAEAWDLLSNEIGEAAPQLRGAINWESENPFRPELWTGPEAAARRVSNLRDRAGRKGAAARPEAARGEDGR